MLQGKATSSDSFAVLLINTKCIINIPCEGQSMFNQHPLLTQTMQFRTSPRNIHLYCTGYCTAKTIILTKLRDGILSTRVPFSSPIENKSIQAPPPVNMPCIISRVTFRNPHSPSPQKDREVSPSQPQWASRRPNTTYLHTSHRLIPTGIDLCHFHFHGHNSRLQSCELFIPFEA